jgi:hypothetical protein
MTSSLTHQSCGFQSCVETASKRCSACKKVYYCSLQHQHNDWKSHKRVCSQLTASNISPQTTSSSVSRSPDPIIEDMHLSRENSTAERRMCRCMFCGEELLLSSEDEAVQHMQVCASLQEQFASKDQFTIPSAIKNKMPKSFDGI